MSIQIVPHGNELLDLFAKGGVFVAEVEDTKSSQSWDLTQRQICDVEMLLNGAFSPLRGFLGKDDYESVLSTMYLKSGVLWPMPITLDVSEKFALSIKVGEKITLRDQEGVAIANMIISDCWKPDKEKEADTVFTTKDLSHPGVHSLFHETGSYYLGGELVGLNPPLHYDFEAYRDSPKSLRQNFVDQGWSRVIAFQTRNPLHRAHVIMTKRLMAEYSANFVIHSAVGITKPGDIDHYCRVRCYEKILNHYPKGTARLSLVPLAMRMAGPREALWQAIIRQNYGFSHFIVGRDHAGPGRDNRGGTFYDVEASQKLVSSFQKELSINIITAPFLLYSQDRQEFCEEDKLLQGEKGLYVSGAELRSLLQNGESIPDWFAFPEIVEELHETLPPRARQGFVVFFTGLSGSGKSTLANGLMVKLRERGGRKITLLDGDVVRKHLSSELSFSKEHRDLNIKRIGFVASEITKNGGVAICAPIAPYAATRVVVKQMIEQVVEVISCTFLRAHIKNLHFRPLSIIYS